jgi:hypothetical protein
MKVGMESDLNTGGEIGEELVRVYSCRHQDEPQAPVSEQNRKRIEQKSKLYPDTDPDADLTMEIASRICLAEEITAWLRFASACCKAGPSSAPHGGSSLA